MAVLNHDQKDSVSEEGEVTSVVLHHNMLSSDSAYIYVISKNAMPFLIFITLLKVQNTNSLGGLIR